MLKKIIICLAFFLNIIVSAYAQDNVKRNEIDKTIKIISDSLPEGWIIKKNINNKDEFIIQSPIIELNGAFDSNDPPTLKEKCEIYILVEPRISPDSIGMIRKRNQELKDKLPPQESKDNLKKWYEENEKTLTILDSEPNHYDNEYSYRIKCRRWPVNQKDLNEYNAIMKYLNQLFKQY